MIRRTRPLLLCGSAALLLALAPATPVHAAAQVVRLSGARVSVVDATRTVVVFEATGDIRGMLTVMLTPGQKLGGEWALVSRYVVDLNTGSEPKPALEGEGEPEEAPAFVERGTLQGDVVGGQLVFDKNGQPAGIQGLRAVVRNASQEFAGASGGGALSADLAGGSGTFELALEVK